MPDHDNGDGTIGGYVSRARSAISHAIDWATGEMQKYVAPKKEEPDYHSTYTQKSGGKSTAEEYTKAD
jgi:hypothetical protein